MVSLAPYVPTPIDIIRRILQIVELKKGELLYDLGSGDGRVLFVAAKEFGARAIGVELRKDLVDKTQERIESDQLEDKVQIIHGNVNDVDLSQTDVVSLYLTTSGNNRIRPKLERELKQGARVVSLDFSIPNWQPEKIASLRGRTIYFFRLPPIQIKLETEKHRREFDRQYKILRENVARREFELERSLLAQRRKVGKGFWNNVILVARRSNSFTPLILASGKKIMGGGYFLVWNGKGIVIDPGYDFLEILYNRFHLGIKDIDMVIVTHDHPDHCADVEKIITLLYEYNELLKTKRKTIDFLLNIGAFFKFEYMLTRNVKYIHFNALKANTSIIFQREYGFVLTATKAHHEELWGEKNYSIGLAFDLLSNDKHFKLAITSDTSWNLDLVEEYSGVDLLITHLGGIESKPNRVLSNHLGVSGVISLLLNCKPSFCVLTEFGEEVGKEVIVCKKDIPGFIANRITIPGSNLVGWMVYKGEYTIEEVDAAAIHKAGMPMGMFGLMDFTGIDVGASVMKFMDERWPGFEMCPLFKEKVEKGELGGKHL